MGNILFWQVSMKPGKDFTFAVLHKHDPNGNTVNVPHFALTGNPSASMINFEVLVRPAILKMTGYSNLEAHMVEAVFEESVKNPGTSRRFVWVTLREINGRYYAQPAFLKNGGVMASLRLADGLAVIPEITPQVKEGDTVMVAVLGWH
jgi:molybdopterin molybdotransferase